MNFIERLSNIEDNEESLKIKKKELLEDVSREYLELEIPVRRIISITNGSYNSAYDVLKQKRYFNADIIKAAIQLITEAKKKLSRVAALAVV